MVLPQPLAASSANVTASWTCPSSREMSQQNERQCSPFTTASIASFLDAFICGSSPLLKLSSQAQGYGRAANCHFWKTLARILVTAAGQTFRNGNAQTTSHQTFKNGSASESAAHHTRSTHVEGRKCQPWLYNSIKTLTDDLSHKRHESRISWKTDHGGV